MNRFRLWLRAFLPAPMRVDARERLRVVAGAIVGLLLTGVLTELFSRHTPGLPWLIAPLGASAVLVFGVPASPLAQPWAVVMGNTASALVGIACAHLFGGAPELAAAIAVGGAIGLMFLLRCLHPPGGAAALLMVLSGVHDWRFALDPVLLNSVLMVVAGMAYNGVTGRKYPHAQTATPVAAPAGGATGESPAFTGVDLDTVLAHYNQVLDIPRDDLQAIVDEAGLLAARRRMTTLRCADVMSSDVKTVEWGTPLQEAWSLLRTHHIKALPVVDRARRVVGIVTLADFMRGASLDVHEHWATRLRHLIRPTPTTHSDKAEVVGQIMSRQVRVASADRPLADLVPLFAATGHHHIPIVGEEARLVGILTQSDLVAALARMDQL
jgi:CBS domain-containing membrane protein